MQKHEFLPSHQLATLQVDSNSSATYLSALIENSPIAIVVLNACHRYILCNPAFQRLFQYSSQDLASSDLDDLITAPNLVKEAATLTRKVLQGNKVHTITQRRRKDGMIVDVELYGVPLIVNDQLVGVYGLYQDVTERNKTQSAFQYVSDKLESIQQEERRRIARDLHDSTSQELAVLNWNLHRLMHLVTDGDQKVKDLVKQSKDLAFECSERIRSASYLLHPPFLGDTGLPSAIAGLAEGFEQRSGIRVDLTIPRNLGRFSNEIEVAFFRIVQEGLANVLRHSGSPIVHISLHKRSNWLKLIVADEGSRGTGDDAARSHRGRVGTGINGMRERLELLGGVLTVNCAPHGTTLIADLQINSKLNG